MKKEWIQKYILGLFALICVGALVMGRREFVKAEASMEKNIYETDQIKGKWRDAPDGMVYGIGDVLVPLGTENDTDNSYASTAKEAEDSEQPVIENNKERVTMETPAETEADLQEEETPGEPEETSMEHSEEEMKAQMSENEINSVTEIAAENRTEKTHTMTASPTTQSDETETDNVLSDISADTSEDASMNETEEEVEETSEETETIEETETEDEISTETEKKADLSVKMRASAEEIKAGRTLRYEIILTNTGEKDLKELQILSLFSKEDVRPIWVHTEHLQTEETTGNAIWDELKQGETCKIYADVEIPEDTLKPLEHSLRVYAKDAETDTLELHRDVQVCTTILPLKINFEVQKTADHGVAYPGNVVTYTILLRNTGERTLHSVLTTERFLTGGIQAVFLRQAGILINKDHTQAYIAQLNPGDEVELKAEVTIPEEITEQDLVNQVYVSTDETGTQYMKSEATVQVRPEPTATPEPEKEEGTTPDSNSNEELTTYSASIVQTGDASETSRWIRVGAASILLCLLIFTAKKARR